MLFPTSDRFALYPHEGEHSRVLGWYICNPAVFYCLLHLSRREGYEPDSSSDAGSECEPPDVLSVQNNLPEPANQPALRHSVLRASDDQEFRSLLPAPAGPIFDHVDEPLPLYQDLSVPERVRR